MSENASSQECATTDIALAFPFARLPVHLRNKVYGLVLTVPKHVQRISHQSQLTSVIDTSILRTSRTTHAEALAVFFQTNTVRINNFFEIDLLVPNASFMANARRIHLLARNFATPVTNDPTAPLIIQTSTLLPLITFIELLEHRARRDQICICSAFFEDSGFFCFPDGSANVADRKTAAILRHFVIGIYCALKCAPGRSRLRCCIGPATHLG